MSGNDRTRGRNMSADRSGHPIVHLVGSIPLPDAETVFRTVSRRGRPAPRPPARRRDRHPQDLDPVPAGRARRESRDRACLGRAAVQVRAVGRQGRARDSAPARQARRQARRRRRSRPAMPTWRSNRGACSTGCSRPASFRPKVKFQISIPTPIAPTYNNMVPADRPELAAGADRSILPARSRRSRRRSRTIASRCNGTCARRCWRGRATTSRVRSTSGSRPSTCSRRSATPCRRRSSSAITCATAARPTSTWCSRRMPASWSRWPMRSPRAWQRPIQFFHMPVPKGRTDDAYFAPLERLKLGDGDRALSRPDPP